MAYWTAIAARRSPNVIKATQFIVLPDKWLGVVRVLMAAGGGAEGVKLTSTGAGYWRWA